NARDGDRHDRIRLQRKQFRYAAFGGQVVRETYLLLCVCAVMALAQTSKGTPPKTADGKPDLSGVWIVRGSTDIAVDPAYQPWAKELWQKRRVDKDKNDDPAAWCLPNGPVRMTTLPFKIIQTPKLIVLLSEGNTHSYRRFFLYGRPHNLELEPNS